MTAEKIAELKRLSDIANLGSLEVTSDCDDDWAIVDHRGECQGVISFLSTAIYYAALHNAFPDLIAALEAAETEADSEAGHWIEIIRRLDPENLCDVFDGLGVEENLRQWLAARDARLKNEGAAEWLENAAREGGYYERSSEGMMEEAAELRRKGING